VQALKPEKGFQTIQLNVTLYTLADIAGHAEYLLGEYAAAEASERLAVEARKAFLTDSVIDRRDIAIKSVWLAMSLARQGHLDEAAKVIDPVVKFGREMLSRNHGDQWVPVEVAGALYAQALTDKSRSSILLSEAARLLDSTAPAVRSTHEVRLWRERVGQTH
jgi:hypothetical protein